jgi:hypothetical protein
MPQPITTYGGALAEARYEVGIVVDAYFGEQALPLLNRMPLWMVDTPPNRMLAEPLWHAASSFDPTHVGAITLFTVDPAGSPESWCMGILDDVDLHHGPLSHVPGYSGLEIWGAHLTPALTARLAEFNLTSLSSFPGGFRAFTADGTPACAANEQLG